jgi:hypothetical protein
VDSSAGTLPCMPDRSGRTLESTGKRLNGHRSTARHGARISGRLALPVIDVSGYRERVAPLLCGRRTKIVRTFRRSRPPAPLVGLLEICAHPPVTRKRRGGELRDPKHPCVGHTDAPKSDPLSQWHLRPPPFPPPVAPIGRERAATQRPAARRWTRCSATRAGHRDKTLGILPRSNWHDCRPSAMALPPRG